MTADEVNAYLDSMAPDSDGNYHFDDVFLEQFAQSIGAHEKEALMAYCQRLVDHASPRHESRHRLSQLNFAVHKHPVFDAALRKLHKWKQERQESREPG